MTGKKGKQNLKEMLQMPTKELSDLLREEAAKLGLNTHIIVVRFGGEYEPSKVTKFKNGIYEIVLSGLSILFDNLRSTLRHELYHIYDGHLEGKRSFIKYLFIQEPRAVIYQYLGIKL